VQPSRFKNYGWLARRGKDWLYVPSARQWFVDLSAPIQNITHVPVLVGLRPKFYIRVVILNTSPPYSVTSSSDIFSTDEDYAYPSAAAADTGSVGISFYATNATTFPEFRVGVLGSLVDKPVAEITSVSGTPNGTFPENIQLSYL